MNAEAARSPQTAWFNLVSTLKEIVQMGAIDSEDTTATHFELTRQKTKKDHISVDEQAYLTALVCFCFYYSFSLYFYIITSLYYSPAL